MDAHHNAKGSNFATGLLLGLILGVSITLLVVTKKGRRLLRTLADEGFENIKDWQSRLKDANTMIAEDLYYDDLEQDSPPPVVAKPSPAPVRVESATEKPNTNGLKKHAKKFFRGIPKKS